MGTCQKCHTDYPQPIFHGKNKKKYLSSNLDQWATSPNLCMTAVLLTWMSVDLSLHCLVGSISNLIIMSLCFPGEG